MISDTKITIFNNNIRTLKNENDKFFSEILEYDFNENKFTNILEKTIKRYDLKTSGILVDFTSEKDFLLEEPDSGLLVMGDKNENIHFQLVNKDTDEKVYFFSWSRLMKNKNIVQTIRKIYDQNKCE